MTKENKNYYDDFEIRVLIDKSFFLDLKKDVRAEHFAKAKVFDDLPEKTILKAENTFCMALDGDVDFKPNAVQLLIDRLRRNKKVGVVCGRIHPIGSGNAYLANDCLSLLTSTKPYRHQQQ